MAESFTQALATARRRAQLSGRPLSQQETAGIASGASDVASERAARLKAIKNQEEQIAEARRANIARERLSKEQLATEARIADERLMAEKKQAEAQGRATGAAVGASVGYSAGGAAVSGAVGGSWGGPVGIVVGAVIGYVGGGSSHYCGAISNVSPGLVPNSDMRKLLRFQQWVDDHHKEWGMLYNQSAPIALDRMKGKMGREFGDYLMRNVKPYIIDAVLSHLQNDDPESAFAIYRDTVIPIGIEFSPEFIPALEILKSVQDKGV